MILPFFTKENYGNFFTTINLFNNILTLQQITFSIKRK